MKSQIKFIKSTRLFSTCETKSNLLSGNYNYFVAQSDKNGFSSTISSLNDFKVNLKKDLENKLNRELVLKTNEALETLKLHNRTVSDHTNLSGNISQNEVYNIYQTLAKDFKNNTTPTDYFLKNSTENNRLVYIKETNVTFY
jgi:hypothetical protein